MSSASRRDRPRRTRPPVPSAPRSAKPTVRSPVGRAAAARDDQHRIEVLDRRQQLPHPRDEVGAAEASGRTTARGARLAEDHRDLALAQDGHDRNRERAERALARNDDRGLPPVRELERDGVSRRARRPARGRRRRRDAAGELREADLELAVDHRDGVGAARCGAGEGVADGDSRATVPSRGRVRAEDVLAGARERRSSRTPRSRRRVPRAVKAPPRGWRRRSERAVAAVDRARWAPVRTLAGARASAAPTMRSGRAASRARARVRVDTIEGSAL